MVPKRIHYCWLSGDPFPQNIQACIDSWAPHLPGYEFVLWDKARFGETAVSYVAEAIEKRRWAFAADYIRVYALFHEGGIYLDSDVTLYQPLDGFLHHRFFSAVEKHPIPKAELDSYLTPDGSRRPDCEQVPMVGIQAAVMGAEAGHPFLKQVLEFYDGNPFHTENGTNFEKEIMPTILAKQAERHGFKYVDRLQELDHGMTLYPSSVFASSPKTAHRDAVAVHGTFGHWRKRPSISARVRRKFRQMTAMLTGD